jgi:hypothetical protein
VKRRDTKVEEAIRYLIGRRLKSAKEVETMDAHPNEDTLCAFVEGRLEQAGSSQMVSHLITCGPCRHITAQLTRLECDPSPESDLSSLDDAPNRLQLLLNKLASRVIPDSEEDAVFAYQDPSESDHESVEPVPEDSEQS